MGTLGEVEKAVVDCASGVYGIDGFDFTMETKLIDERVGGDSLDAALVVCGIEEKFDIAIPESASDKFDTLGDIAKYVFENQSECQHIQMRR